MLNTELVKVKNLSFSRGERVIFDDISLEVPQGKITAIMGPSGIGKTTLLRLIGGQLPPDSGEIWFKLDYWNQKSLKLINRTRLSSDQLISNLILLGKGHPLVIQSCLFRWDSEEFTEEIYQPYLDQLKHILHEGAQIKLLQLYTLARPPADNKAQAWTNDEMNRLGRFINKQIDIKTEIYYAKGKPE